MILDKPDTYVMMLEEETEGVIPDEYGNTNTCMMGRSMPRPFELVTGSDAESDAESIQDEGSDYFDSDAEELAPEHRGQVRYVHLGRQMTKEDHANKAPVFVKELLEYFNGKLHALKLSCRTEVKVGRWMYEISKIISETIHIRGIVRDVTQYYQTVWTIVPVGSMTRGVDTPIYEVNHIKEPGYIEV